MLKSLTAGDKVLIVLLVLAIVSSFSLIGVLVPSGSSLLVEVDGVPRYRSTLSDESVFRVRGTRGELELEVRDGSVRVVKAECPNKICIRTGARSRAGDIIVCVPNRTIIRINSGESSRVGGVTG